MLISWQCKRLLLGCRLAVIVEVQAAKGVLSLCSCNKLCRSPPVDWDDIRQNICIWLVRVAGRYLVTNVNSRLCLPPGHRLWGSGQESGDVQGPPHSRSHVQVKFVCNFIVNVAFNLILNLQPVLWQEELRQSQWNAVGSGHHRQVSLFSLNFCFRATPVRIKCVFEGHFSLFLAGTGVEACPVGVYSVD